MVEKSRLDRMIALMDAWLRRRDREIAEGTYYDDDEDTDPVQFQEGTGRNPPIAEPPAMPQEDTAPAHIHGAASRDLFT